MDPDSPNEGGVIYRKADLTDAEDNIWDDSALIKMYDDMINKTHVLSENMSKCDAKRIPTAKKKKKFHKASKIKWHVGDHCMAPYYNDQLWYPAVVKKLDLDDGKCDVLYDVYDELARVSIADLTKSLHAKPSMSLMGSRHCYPNFPRSAIRPTTLGSDPQQLQPQQCRKRKIRKCRPNWPNFVQMECGEKRMRQQTFTIFSNIANFQRSVAFNLPRSTYLMRVLDNLRHQKPMENDEEDTSEGNTTQKTFDTEENVSQTNHTQSSKKHFNFMQPSSVDQHTSIPPLIPPPPTAFNSLSAPKDDEALASMLMSWYMTGYHTGYYQAMQDKKKKAGKKV